MAYFILGVGRRGRGSASLFQQMAFVTTSQGLACGNCSSQGNCGTWSHQFSNVAQIVIIEILKGHSINIGRKAVSILLQFSGRIDPDEVLRHCGAIRNSRWTGTFA